MGPPTGTEQLIRDYLNRLSVAARDLAADDRRALLERIHRIIDQRANLAGRPTTMDVGKVLARLGNPAALVERERRRLAAQGKSARPAESAGPGRQRFLGRVLSRETGRLRGASFRWPAQRDHSGRAGSAPAAPNGVAAHPERPAEKESQDAPADGRGSPTSYSSVNGTAHVAPPAPPASQPSAPAAAAAQPSAPAAGASQPSAPAAGASQPSAPAAAEPSPQTQRPPQLTQPSQLTPQPQSASGPAESEDAVAGTARDAVENGPQRAADRSATPPAASPPHASPPPASRSPETGPRAASAAAASASAASASARNPANASPGGANGADADLGLASEGPVRRLVGLLIGWVRNRPLEAAAVALMGIGGPIFPPVFLLGATLALASELWDGRDKWVGLALPIVLSLIGLVIGIAVGGRAHWAHDAWLYLNVASRISPVLGAAYLTWRSEHVRRPPAVPPFNRPRRAS